MTWNTVKLCEVCSIRPPKSEVKTMNLESSLVSFMGMEHLGIGEKYAYPSIEKKIEEVYSGYTYFAENDVLLAKITPCFENGKLGIAKKLKNGIGFGSTEFFVLRPNSDLISDWLYYFLSRHEFLKEGAKNMSGAVGQKRVNAEFVRNYLIPIPPLAEQKRIAEILDKANEIKAKRELALAKLDELAMSMFEELCEKDKMKKNIKIENLVIKNKLIDTDKEEVWNFTLDQIDSNGGEINGFLQVNRSEVGSSTYYFKPPVVLYSKLRPYLNKVVMPEIDGYATTELVPLYCNEELISPVFLLNYLRSKKFVEFANINSGGAKMPRVMMDKFWKHEIKLPSKVTQHKFDLIYDQIKAQKSILKNNLTTHNLLFNSLQHEAFTTGFNA